MQHTRWLEFVCIAHYCIPLNSFARYSVKDESSGLDTASNKTLVIYQAAQIDMEVPVLANISSSADGDAILVEMLDPASESHTAAKEMLAKKLQPAGITDDNIAIRNASMAKVRTDAGSMNNKPMHGLLCYVMSTS